MNNEDNKPEGSSRREFFRTTAGGLGMAALAASGVAGVAGVASAMTAPKVEKPEQVTLPTPKATSKIEIGDKVVCVKGCPNPNKTRGRRVPDGFVKNGETYTVTGFSRSGGLLLKCKRVLGPKGKIGWAKSRFQLAD